MATCGSRNNTGNRIGRITPLGVVTEFSAGITAGAQPVGITAGPDGNLWFTEYSGDRIGRITPLGVVTEFSAGITRRRGTFRHHGRPDGNLWFTELSGNRIGRITTGVAGPFDYFTLNPCRVLDTRESNGSLGGPALAANTDRTFVASGACVIPSTAKALSVNLTVTQPTEQGDLRLYPAGVPLPLVSTINYSAGQTRANNAILVLGPSGDFAVRCVQGSGTAHFILDVNGYFE